MKCIVVRKIGAFEIEERPVPEPGDGEVLVQVAVTGLCRTDLKIVEQGHRDLVLPRIPGEEVVGRVIALGSGVTSPACGAMVYVYPGAWCGICPACQKGAENLCRRMRIMGFHRDGGFSQYVVARAQSTIPVPADLGADEAVFAEPLSCCLNALDMARLAPGDAIAIWGAGPAGTLLARAAMARGAIPTVIEPDPRRRALAQGVESVDGRFFDSAVVAVGARSAYLDALAHLKPRGCLVVFSGLHPAEDCVLLRFNFLHYLEQTVCGAYGCCWRHGEQALRMLADKSVKVHDMISHRLPLADLESGLDIVRKRSGMKVLLYPNEM